MCEAQHVVEFICNFRWQCRDDMQRHPPVCPTECARQPNEQLDQPFTEAEMLATMSCVRDFLTDRAAAVGLTPLSSEKLRVRPRGSESLFTLMMRYILAFVRALHHLHKYDCVFAITSVVCLGEKQTGC
ncbi:hypothetical protein HPB50_013257 [Hyalomma asiaticum]|uniref:Uncharacterized protein n=1 Tax=Hyalomma asiaticum TaxID=266040 RepID=A0ACB7T0A5_HYAAI|nr:hypothetical protein HPB50_013257 [Hyalomma asiaticum]